MLSKGDQVIYSLTNLIHADTVKTSLREKTVFDYVFIDHLISFVAAKFLC